MSIPIIIDNGSYQCRAGYALGDDPSLVFRNVITKSRARHKSLYVGVEADDFEITRNGSKSPFELNLVTQLDVQEIVFNHIFKSLGIDGTSIAHPIVITEALCCPNLCRSQVSQLLFETYTVDKIAYFVDSLSSYYANMDTIRDLEDTMIVSLGYQTTHLIPIIHSQRPSDTFPALHSLLLPSACRRLSVGGSHITWYLQQLLSLKYPCHAWSLTTGVVEKMVHEHARVAYNYREEMHRWTSDDYRIQQTKTWTLPYAENSTVSLQNIAREKRLKVKRLRELLQKRQQIKAGLVSSRTALRDANSASQPPLISALDVDLGGARGDCEPPSDTEANDDASSSGGETCAAALGSPPNLSSAAPGGRGLRALQLLSSLALPAAVQSQMVTLPNGAGSGLSEARLHSRSLAAEDLEARRGDNFLEWLMFVRRRRERVAKQRAQRLLRVDLATELGLRTFEEAVPGPGDSDNGRAKKARSVLEPYSNSVRAGSVGERRQRQLEKIRALAAELKPERGRAKTTAANQRTAGRIKATRDYPSLKRVPEVTRETQSALSNCSLPNEAASISVSDLTEDNAPDTVFMDYEDSLSQPPALDEPPPRPCSELTLRQAEEEFSSVRVVDKSAKAPARDSFDRLEEGSDVSESERDQLAVLDSLRALYDPEYLQDLDNDGLKIDVSDFYKIKLGTELVRTPEVLFERSLIGSSQAGIGECFSWVLRDASEVTGSQSGGVVAAWRPRRIFLTGGPANLPGLAARLQAELLQLLPCNQVPVPDVLLATDPSLDAWRGARKWSLHATEAGDCGFVSRKQYDEMGPEYLAENHISNKYYGSLKECPLNTGLLQGRGRPTQQARSLLEL